MKKSSDSSKSLFNVKPYALIVCEESSRTGSCEGDYASVLNKALEPFFDIAEPVRSGIDLWPILLNRIPDVVIISNSLPQVDPITLIRSLRLSRYCIDIRYFLLCDKVTDSIRNICSCNDIVTAISRSEAPEVSAKTIYARFNEYLARREQAALSDLHSFIDDVLFFNDGLFDKSIMKSISKTVIEPIGLDAKHKGTYYLQLIICMRVLGIDEELSKLYTVTAEFTGSTKYAVEKAIRYSIEKAWERSSPYMQYFLFGNTIDESRGKPTNSEFVATMAQHVKESL